MFEINFRFGLELEFTRKTNREKLSKMISAALPKDTVLVTTWQKNMNNTEWVCKTDSSCGYEVCTPVFNSLSDLIRLQKVLASFEKNGANVSKSCGVHVHLESKSFTVYQMRKILINWVNFEHLIFSMFPEHRRNNRFCLPVYSFIKKEKYSPTGLIQTVSKHKNRSLNVRGYHTRGTIEFRLMEGSIDAEDIINWVIFLEKFVTRCLDMPKPDFLKLCSLEQLFNFLELEDKIELNLQEWIVQRIKSFE